MFTKAGKFIDTVPRFNGDKFVDANGTDVTGKDLNSAVLPIKVYHVRCEWAGPDCDILIATGKEFHIATCPTLASLEKLQASRW